jgi:hypothetical protein
MYWGVDGTITDESSSVRRITGILVAARNPGSGTVSGTLRAWRVKEWSQGNKGGGLDLGESYSLCDTEAKGCRGWMTGVGRGTCTSRTPEHIRSKPLLQCRDYQRGLYYRVIFKNFMWLSNRGWCRVRKILHWDM